MRQVVRALAIAALVAAGLAAPASAAYVFFHRLFGDWAVLCWREAGRAENLCTYSAPKPGLDAGVRLNVLQVNEYAEGRFQVVIEVRDDVQPGSVAFLRVDENVVHETGVENGLARWYGPEAIGILNEMREGARVVYRVQTVPDGLPHDTAASLEGFAEGFEIYRAVLRHHVVLKK